MLLRSCRLGWWDVPTGESRLSLQLSFQSNRFITSLRFKTGLLFAVLPSVSPLTADAAVLWMDQARRLQQVSASFLDTMPVPSPIRGGFSLGLRADVSFLPAVNPRVGSKLEALPSAPVQAIPAFAAGYGLSLAGPESLSLEVWSGGLPRGVEKLMGIAAALQQFQWGGRAELSSARIGAARVSLGAGLVRTESSLSGKISSENGTDGFVSEAVLSFANFGLQHVRSGLWGAVTIGRKNTKSRLSISDDNTDLEIEDSLADARQPHWSQVSVGMPLGTAVSLAISELMIPDRLEMPRISLSWQFVSPSGVQRE